MNTLRHIYQIKEWHGRACTSMPDVKKDAVGTRCHLNCDTRILTQNVSGSNMQSSATESNYNINRHKTVTGVE